MRNVVVVLAAAVAAAVHADVVTHVWTGAKSTAFEERANWADGSAPQAGEAVTFPLAGAVHVGAPITLSDMIFANTGALNLSGSALTIDGSIEYRKQDNAVTTRIANPVAFSAGAKIVGGDEVNKHTHTLHLDGVVSGDGLAKEGSGALYLNAANTYDGVTTLKGTDNNTWTYIHSLGNIGEGASSLGAPTTAENGLIRLHYMRLVFSSSQRKFYTTDRDFELDYQGILRPDYGVTVTYNGNVKTVYDLNLYSDNLEHSTNIFNGVVEAQRVKPHYGGVAVLNNVTNHFSASDGFGVKIVLGGVILNSIAPIGTTPNALGTNDYEIAIGDTWLPDPENSWFGRLALNSPTGGTCDRKIRVYTTACNIGNSGFHLDNLVAGQMFQWTGPIYFVGISAAPAGPTQIHLGGVGDGELTPGLPELAVLIKNGTGTWILSGESHANDQPVSIREGTLCVNGAMPGIPSLAVESGGTLAGTGTVAGVVSVAAAGTVCPGGTNGVGTLTLDKLNLARDAKVMIRAHLNEAGEFVADSKLAVNELQSEADPIIVFRGLENAGGDFVIPSVSAFIETTTASDVSYTIDAATLPAGTMVERQANGGFKVLLPKKATADLTWNTTSGVWDFTEVNWHDGTEAVAYVDNANVTFADGASPSADPAVVTFGAQVEPVDVHVTAEVQAYAFCGAYGLSGSANFTKSGAGAFTLENKNTYFGKTVVNAGTYTMKAGSSLKNTAITIGKDAVFAQEKGSVIEGDASLTMDFKNKSTVYFNSDNTFDGDVSMTVVEGGDNGGTGYSTVFVSSPSAFGSEKGITKLAVNDNLGHLHFYVNNSVAVTNETLHGLYSANCYIYLTIGQSNTGTNTWQGDIIIGDENISDKRCVFSISGQGAVNNIGKPFEKVEDYAGHTIRVVNKGQLEFARNGGTRVNIYSSIISPHRELTKWGGTQHLYMTNDIKGIYGTSSDCGTVVWEIDEALNRTATPITNGSTWDLNGHTQTFSKSVFAAGGTGPYLTSETPATLVLAPPKGTTISSAPVSQAAITGAVSVVKCDAGTYNLGGPNYNTGTLTVEAGTLAATTDHAFGAVSNLVVRAGTLQFNAAQAVGPGATLQVKTDDNAKVVVGVPETVVDFLEVNGVPRPAGTYGTSGSGANYTVDWFADGSAGVLRVRKCRTGMMMIIR